MAAAELGRYLMQSGFDTRIGLFHGVRYGRESLPLDLVDELRVPMVDRFTVNILHRRQIVAADFAPADGGGVRLNDDARRRYLELWEAMLAEPRPLQRGEVAGDDATPTTVGRNGDEVGDADAPPNSWRQRMRRQVARLYEFLMRCSPYRGILADSQ